MSDERPQDQSDIPPIELPPGGFVSRIPPHLLVDRPETEQFVLSEASKMAHFIEWAAPVIMATHGEVRKTNGSVKGLLAFKAMFYSVWGFCGALLSVIGGLAGLFAVIQFIASYFHPTP